MKFFTAVTVGLISLSCCLSYSEAIELKKAKAAQVHAAVSEQEVAPQDMSEPPFWMSSYDEFKDLQGQQKEFYLDKLATNFKAISSLESINLNQLKEASEWFKDWDKIRRKVYSFCATKRDKKIQSQCEGLAEIRIQSLAMLANQKIENRREDSDDDSEEDSETEN